MTIQEATYSKQPFAVWARLGETFSVLGRRPWVFFGFSFVVGILIPYAIFVGLIYLAVQSSVVLMAVDDGFETMVTVIFGIITAFTQLFLYGVLTAGAYDACTGAKRPTGAYIGLALRRMMPLALVLIPVGIIIGLGYVIIGILGLWATAVYSAILPIVVVEKLGFRSIGRARALSKEYRWPIVGYLLILGLMLIAVVVLIVTLIAAIGETAAIYLAPLLLVFLMPLSATVTCVASAVVYARLRAIKEGNTVAELADVFA